MTKIVNLPSGTVVGIGMLLAEGFIHEMLNCYFSQFHDFLLRLSSGTYEFNATRYVSGLFFIQISSRLSNLLGARFHRIPVTLRPSWLPCNLDLECGEFVYYHRVIEKFEGQLEVPAPIEWLCTVCMIVPMVLLNVSSLFPWTSL